jgi:hypothetical protein
MNLTYLSSLYFHPIIRDRTVLVTALGTLASLIAAFLLLYTKSSAIPSEVPLWYTMPTVSHLASTTYLWYLPAMAVVIWAFNTLLGFFIFRRSPVAAHILAVTALVISFMVLLAVIRTITIYTSLL